MEGVLGLLPHEIEIERINPAGRRSREPVSLAMWKRRPERSVAS